MAALGIIAGAGDLPRLIYEDRISRGLQSLVIDFEGIEVDWPEPSQKFTARFEKPESIFDALRDAGCKELVMVGAMQRPKLDPALFDPTFAGIAPALMTALQVGDDAALKVVLGMFEAAGFEILAPQSVLGALSMGPGCPTIAQPSSYDEKDAARASEILDHMGPLDIGQGCVVAGGLCLGVETLQGTQRLLDFVRETDPGLRPERGILMKAPKAGQDDRLDIPAIGPDTMDQLAAAHISGIVIPAGKVLVINREEVIKRADSHGLFVWSRD